MCMIALKFGGIELPKEEHLRESAIRNKDGIGIAYWKFGTNEVKIKKNFVDVSQLIIWMHDNIKKEDVCIIHFRLATHGLIDEGNRHPFPITKNKELLRKTELICQNAVAHNGVISEYGEGKFSDTQKFVLDILSDETIKGNYNNPAIKKLIGNFLNGDRLVILNNDGTVYTWGDWIKEEDIYYSNSGYKNYFVTYDFSKDRIYDFQKDKDGKWNLCKRQKNKKEYKGFCDICNKREKIKEVWYKDILILMCKVCRKEYSKGKLKLKDYYEETGDFTEEEKSIPQEVKPIKFIYRPQNLSENIGLEVQCESCLDWFYKEELIYYYGAKLCKKCIEGIGAINPGSSGGN